MREKISNIIFSNLTQKDKNESLLVKNQYKNLLLAQDAFQSIVFFSFFFLQSKSNIGYGKQIKITKM